MNRRHMLTLTSVAGFGIVISRSGNTATGQNGSGTFREEQSGDPDSPLEPLTVNLESVATLLDVGKSIGIRKNAHLLAARALQIAQEDSRILPHPDTTQIEEYLRLFGVDPRASDGRLQPFCAAGLSHTFCRAYCELTPDRLPYPHTKEGATARLRILRDVLSDLNKFYFLPHCSTQQMVIAAKERNVWIDGAVPNTQIRQGWLVFFNWPDPGGHRSGLPNHVGIVQHADPNKLHTVEYNTSIKLAGDQRRGGCIASRARDYGNVLGYISYFGSQERKTR